MSEYYFTSLSTQSLRYRERRKPEVGNMPYSYRMTLLTLILKCLPQQLSKQGGQAAVKFCILWTLTLKCYPAAPPIWSIGLEGGGGEGLVDLVNQLTLERCHSFWFHSSCRKRIPIRDSSMPKRILSQCGVSSKMFIGLIVPTTCFSVCWD